MKYRIIVTIISILLSISAIIYAGNNKPKKPIIEEAISAEWIEEEIDGLRFPKSFKIKAGECEFIIDLNLNNVISNAKIIKKCNGLIKEGRLSVQQGARLWLRMNYLFYENDLILIFDIQNDQEDWGGGMIARIDTANLDTKWSQDIFGFNTCPCLREDNFLYITASNYIGNLNLQNGKYIWKYNISNQINYDQFQKVLVSGNNLIFKPYDIIVNKKNGKIIKPIDLKVFKLP